VFHQLSNGISHFMPSTVRRLELKVKDIDDSDRLTADCVLIDLASPAVSWMAVYANGLRTAVYPVQCMRMTIRCGMAVRRMVMLRVSVRKMKALTVKMEQVTLVGKGRQSLQCSVY
jgi:hypothetical protein